MEDDFGGFIQKNPTSHYIHPKIKQKTIGRSNIQEWTQSSLKICPWNKKTVIMWGSILYDEKPQENDEIGQGYITWSS